MNNLKEMFGDVKFICMGGSARRMHNFALYIKDLIDYPIPAGLTLQNISEITDRYAMYKVVTII
jgi:uridine phosphorylase